MGAQRDEPLTLALNKAGGTGGLRVSHRYSFHHISGQEGGMGMVGTGF
jgi:hypothetical protein